MKRLQDKLNMMAIDSPVRNLSFVIDIKDQS